MAWERRERGGLYFYRSHRVNGRVVKEYLGRGQLASLVSRLMEIESEEKAEDRRKLKEEQRQLDAIESEIDRLCQEAEEAAKQAMQAAGYHQHSRGEWRKRRAKDREGEGHREQPPSDSSPQRADARGRR